ncbi:hypothetical protein [Streptomyces virginiae]|uniref:hypothetical protein n=1 Tax=Streptomyces virginiae TaxID=1961 RepID=UPI00224EC631|nr:hypothetical protein [Streptomyces virginiae]MCX5176751.1 hypothetical protein [Streptomyces virginiae]
MTRLADAWRAVRRVLTRLWDALATLATGRRTATGEQATRPTHPDGTPYRYAEIVAEGWSCCDGCLRWGRTWTPERPHICPNEPQIGTS